MIKKWKVEKEGEVLEELDFDKAVKRAASLLEEGYTFEVESDQKTIKVFPLCPHTHYSAIFIKEIGPTGDIEERLEGYRCAKCKKVVEEI